MTAALGRALADKEVHALRALTRDPFLGRGGKENTCPGPATETPEAWRSKEPTETENQAAIVLQATWKSFHIRQVRKATRTGTHENMKVSETLLKMWAALASNAQKHAVSLLRYIFSNSKSAELYPCHGDEWTRVPFKDYSVTFPEQPSNSWFLVFREVFHVPKDMLVVPKVYSAVPGCVLHVIDNDTGEEVPRIFQTVEPRVYKRNQVHSFLTVAPDRQSWLSRTELYRGIRVKEATPLWPKANPEKPPVPGGKWRLRLIGSHDPPPGLSREAPLSNFSVKEFRDYYIPNDKNVICRFSLKVTSDHVGTVQIQTSKPDVYVKLTVLDRESDVASSTGKGSVVIPVSPSEASPARGQQDTSGSAGSLAAAGLTADPPGGGGAGGVQRRRRRRRQPAEILGHKYIIQAQVLHKSWALDESQAAFVQALKDAERNDSKGTPRLVRYAMSPFGARSSPAPPSCGTLLSDRIILLCKVSQDMKN
ncbi:hypothetical protein SKAU_G00185040 [Synaphobranchus kaupii]|uniref:Globin domain-containing protein n=1 Tax=Synaphobranchus kaupii TaxID=118154 RepID=A0A9Q1FCD2_SYNKA|nr:hypothetical protein SKAU_G00185040 [Synaphobranchus kaupii]